MSIPEEYIAMPEEKKTIAIDTSALVEKQRERTNSGGDVPKTIAIDSDEIVGRFESARETSPQHPVKSDQSWTWVALTAVAVVALVAYLIAG